MKISLFPFVTSLFIIKSEYTHCIIIILPKPNGVLRNGNYNPNCCYASWNNYQTAYTINMASKKPTLSKTSRTRFSTKSYGFAKHRIIRVVKSEEKPKKSELMVFKIVKECG